MVAVRFGALQIADQYHEQRATILFGISGSSPLKQYRFGQRIVFLVVMIEAGLSVGIFHIVLFFYDSTDLD